MRRGPVGAAAGIVERALAPGGEAVGAELVGELWCGDKVRAERAARGLKKIAEARREALYGLRKEIYREALRATEVRVQWNLTIVLGRLPLKGRDKAVTVDLMFERLRDPSGLNRTFALQALWDLSEEDAGLRARVMPVVKEFEANGTPAMRAAFRAWAGSAFLR